MASAAKVHAWEISSIKAFAESKGDYVIPSTYHSMTESHDDVADELADSIPVIDLSLLTSKDPEIHAKAVSELGKACAEWGFIMVSIRVDASRVSYITVSVSFLLAYTLRNHGIPEKLMEELMNKAVEFHYLPVEEKMEFDDKGKSHNSPIRYGTSFNPHAEKVHYWRDYLKVITSPEFNFPNKPPGYRDLAFDYCRKIRSVGRKLLEGISESLGLESNSIIESTGYDSGFQTFVANFYPPCPQPHLAQGMPSHSDHGLMTFLIQNGIGGLQIKHDGKWINVNPLPNSLPVILGDHLEVVSNGRYPGVIHRAILNNQDNRISLVVGNGPALDKQIGPVPELLSENEKPLFKGITFNQYFRVQQNTPLADKSTLDAIRLNA
ncbi:hypothetical protein VNO77_10107 [Canavalia gladiata]|uniref:Fe2OG dioxygenase domain-containing protein n=1 Tax=Canavalia gladiata TaxID=3824 RepID=A0AAN9MA11_CANGL